eukprot:4090961-Amphidinium_carterae.2
MLGRRGSPEELQLLSPRCMNSATSNSGCYVRMARRAHLSMQIARNVASTRIILLLTTTTAFTGN